MSRRGPERYAAIAIRRLLGAKEQRVQRSWCDPARPARMRASTSRAIRHVFRRRPRYQARSTVRRDRTEARRDAAMIGEPPVDMGRLRT